MEQKINIIALVLAMIVVVFAMVVLIARPSQVSVSTTGAQKDTISVVGNAVTATSPDQVEILVNIKTESGSAKSAKDQNAQLSENVRKALRNVGVDGKEIETTSFNIYPKYRWEEETGKQILDGYIAENSLKITTKKPDKAGDFIDVAVNNGATINYVQFSLSREKQEEMNEVALQLAADNAKAKANSIAAAMGINLGKIASISESNVNYVPPRPFYGMEYAVAKESAAAGTEVTPGEVEVTAYITANYYMN